MLHLATFVELSIATEFANYVTQFATPLSGQAVDFTEYGNPCCKSPTKATVLAHQETQVQAEL